MKRFNHNYWRCVLRGAGADTTQSHPEGTKIQKIQFKLDFVVYNIQGTIDRVIDETLRQWKK